MVIRKRKQEAEAAWKLTTTLMCLIVGGGGGGGRTSIVNENGTSQVWPSVRGALIPDIYRYPSPPPPPPHLIATPSIYGYSVKIPPPHFILTPQFYQSLKFLPPPLLIPPPPPPPTIKHNRVLRKNWHANQIFEFILEQCTPNYYGHNRGIIS